MPLRENLPSTASQAKIIGKKKLYSASAARNAPFILEVLSQYLPDKGKVLEIASGTGQHCTYFAEAFCNLEWQPSEINPKRLDSIQAYIKETNQVNINMPLSLDATAENWAKEIDAYNVIIVINFFHLISNKEMKTLIRESSLALQTNSYFVIYGPFMRGGELTSDQDIKFHTSLFECDPDIGYKDDFDILDEIEANNLSPEAIIEMPSNNLMFVAKK
ncbi:class I SAM-dependent methyltransferase [Paracoccaceae bacterium]|nr:class I SAM-dependent methyltransferase [Paracoccaceae bacterium]|tara:strand:- start:15030 stop:15683 length:654 start_codon:yes stop_codon:yes gene_type:complete